MTEPVIFIDAGVFLGMHHRDVEVRAHCLAFFHRQQACDRVRMNYEQIGVCDAIIWRQSRRVQDAYYPFMDRLHSDMPLQRGGYTFEEMRLALAQPELQDLRPEQALLAGQVLRSEGLLFTRDPALRRLGCLRAHLMEPEAPAHNAGFAAPLQALYEASRVFVYADEH